MSGSLPSFSISALAMTEIGTLAIRLVTSSFSSLPFCYELMVDLHLVLFLQQIWVCQQQVFECVWESDNSSQLTQQSLQWRLSQS